MITPSDSDFQQLEHAFFVTVALAVVGFLTLVGAAGAAINWLISHVHIAIH